MVDSTGLSIDIREQPGNSSSSLVKGGKPLHENQSRSPWSSKMKIWKETKPL